MDPIFSPSLAVDGVGGGVPAGALAGAVDAGITGWASAGGVT
jgi:hypothetical protein